MIHYLKRTLCNKALRFVGLLSVMVMFLGVISNTSYGQGTTPPANTTIGNQATATYIDNGGNSQTVTSNTVESVVQQVAGVTLSAGLNKTVSPGGTVTFPHTITNNGNGTDSFNLTAVDANTGNFNYTNIDILPDADGNGVPDNSTPISSTPNVDAGDSYGIIISANMPASAIDGQVEGIDVDVESAFDNNETANATDQTTVEEDAVIDVQKSVDKSTADTTDTVTFTLTFSNNGNAAGQNLTIRDQIPAGLTYVAGSGDWSGSASGLTDNADGDEGGITYEFKSGAQDSIVAAISTLNAGASGTLKFSAAVDENTEGQTFTNVAQYNHDDLGSKVNTNGASVTVEDSYGVEIVGAQDVVESDVEQGSTINFVNLYENTGTATDTYNITLGSGNYPGGTTFTLYKTDGAGNPTSPYTDTNGDGTPDTGPIAAGDQVEVILRVNLPTNANGPSQVYAVDKTLTSVNDGSQTATHTDKLDGIVKATIDLTNDAATGDTGALGENTGPESTIVQSKSSNPGTTVSFTLFIENTSAIDDNYGLSFGTSVTGTDLDNPGALPSGWTVKFRDPNNGNSVITSTGALSSGDSKEVTAVVTIPAGASPVTNQALYFRALSSTTGAKDILYDAVTILTNRTVSLSSNNTGQIFPGGSKTYTHTLTINSNVDENDGTNSDFQVDVSNTEASFTAVVYWDTDGDGVVTAGTDSLLTTGSGGIVDLPSQVGTLQFGDQVKFIVKVSASTGASDGASNTTTLTISDNVGPISDKTNEDITEVVAGLLTVEKFQAEANSDGDPQTSGTFKKTQFNVLPGDTVYYKVSVTNDGAAPVTTVTITDNTPSYTTQLGGVSVSGDGSPSIDSEPGNGNSGTIEVGVGTLNPGESFDITFKVKVDE